MTAKNYQSLSSALKACNRFERAFNALHRRLHNIAARDACKGDIFIGWDMPTLRIVRPDDYAKLVSLNAAFRHAQAFVHYYSPTVLEHAV